MVSRKRHILKTITWRIIGTLDTMILSWIITGNWKWELIIGGVELITKMVLYYFHERPGINLQNMELIKPYVRNEWDDLKEIIVGTTKGAQVPTVGDKCLHSIDYNDLSDEQFKNRPSDPYPNQVMEEMEEDLEGIVRTLQDLGVKVHRPIDRDFSQPIVTENWTVDGYYNYSKRFYVSNK